MKNLYPDSAHQTIASNYDYYELTKDHQPRPLLVEAVTLLESDQTQALDLGCGAGNETRFLLERGFTVTAVDSNRYAGQYIMDLPHAQERARFVHASFNSFEYEMYDLVNALYSLSFMPRPYLEEVMGKILGSIKSKGIFVGNFFGPNDEWNIPESQMTFIDKDETRNILADMEVITLTEHEHRGPKANNTLKNWHIVSFVAKKP